MRKRVLGAILGLYFAVACGKTTENPEPESQAAGASPGSGGSADAVATGGSAGAGVSQSVTGVAGVAGVTGVAGARPIGSGGGGTSAPMPYPLIIGDDACPPAAPRARACTVDGASCVYAGFPSSGFKTTSPMACSCSRGRWSCVSSDEEGDSACPLEQPAMQVAGPCPPKAALPCIYAPFDPPALAFCDCTQEPVGGEGGAGGDAGVTSNWSCGL